MSTPLAPPLCASNLFSFMLSNGSLRLLTLGSQYLVSVESQGIAAQLKELSGPVHIHPMHAQKYFDKVVYPLITSFIPDKNLLDLLRIPRILKNSWEFLGIPTNS